MWLSGSQGILYIFLQRKRLHIRLYVYAGVLQKHSLMVTASMAGLMMPVSSMAVLAGLCATGNAAGVVGMAAHVRTTGNAAGIMGMATHVCTTGNAAGIMGMAAHVCASCYAAVVISMSVIRRVGIAVLAVVHVSGCFGTTRNAAGAVAVFTGLCTSVNAAKSVCVCGFQSAACNTAVMIPMSVIRGVGIAVLAVVHVGGCFGTTRNAAGTVAVFAGLCTAVDTAKSVLVYFRLCTTCHFAGNACSIFLCRPLDFRGTLIYRIGDNTACHHGNGYKRNG